ncbi:FimV/HubP family polar landmark protein [Algiphilus sp.]|uniref:FimV/HubP family polar landmark protein n=1 Tax=Algiphilus sp. TaxID=1872431 RepID=UPI003BA88E9B
MSALSRFTLLAVFALCASAAHAVGLGPVEVRSFLNEPLRAQVVLSDVPVDRLQTLSASIASERAYEELGLARNDYLRNVTVSVTAEGGTPVLRLRGERPLQEPLLELLVVVRDGRQLVQRSYTLLIDPPQFAEDTEANASATRTASPAVNPMPTGASSAAERPSNARSEATVRSAPVAQRQTTASADDDAPARAATATPASTPTPASTSATVASDAPSEAGTVQSDATTAPDVDAPTFFTTESERTLDPELLAEIGQGTVSAPPDSAVERGRTSAAQPARTSGIYPVRRGETLWRVASNTRPSGQGISMQQMMLAIVERNPDAFENGDATQLRAGARLRIPEVSTIQQIDQGRALREMQALLDEGQTIRSLDGGSTQKAAAPPSESASIAPDAIDETPAETETAVADSSGEADSTLSSEVAAMDAGPNTASDGNPDNERAPQAAAESSEGTAAQALAAATLDDVADGSSEGNTDDSTPVTADEGEEADRMAAAPEESSIRPAADRQPAPNDQKPVANTSAQEAEAAISAERTGSTPPTEGGQPGVWFGLPWYLLLVAFGVLLLGAAAIIEMRRRAAQRAAYEQAEEPTTVSLTGAMAAASPDTAVDDAAQSEVEEPLSDSASASDTSESLEETSAEDDPIADADFRIAYGMYDDAAARLTDAIGREPENAALRLKLAEVHCAAGDKERFLDAADVAARSGLTADEEQELAEMARRIAPESRFATALGASLAASAMLDPDDVAASPDKSPGWGEITEDSSGADISVDEVPDGGDRAEAAGAMGAAGSTLSETSSVDDEDFPTTAMGEDAAAQDDDVPPPGSHSDAAPASESSDNVLEFDLEGLDFDDTGAAAASGAADAPGDTPVADDHALDFDLDQLSLPEDGPEVASTTSAERRVDDNTLDFDWDASAEPIPMSDERDGDVEGAGPKASDALDLEAELLTGDEPLRDPSTASPSSTGEQSDPPSADDLDEDGFDLGDFSLEDFDLGSDGDGDGDSAIAAPDVPREEPTLELPEDPPSPAATETQSEDAFELDDFEIDPVAEGPDTTVGADEGLAGKLDLARAYVDMGEGEMARPLLEAVVQGGDATQREEAQRLLDISG